MNQSQKLAFFDLDHTLIPVDSCGLWCYWLIDHLQDDRKEEYRKTQLRFDEEYFEGNLDIVEFMDFEMDILRKLPAPRLEEIRKEYLERFIIPQVTPEALDLVARHKAAGHKVIMVTATYRYVVEPIAELFGVDELICAEPEKDSAGNFNGKWRRHVFKTAKVAAVLELVGSLGGEKALKGSYFYSDSINDVPLLELVASHGGTAVATNPDKYLREIAEKRKWRILDLFETKMPVSSDLME